MIVFALAAAVIARLWIMPLWSSLWLDEFGTAWVTSGRWDGLVERARLFPQSLPYAAIVEASRGVVGASEAALRWPSLLAMLAAAVAVVALGRALFDRRAGRAAGIVFLLFPAVEFAAADARPYAFAVLAAAAAPWLLVRWLDRGRIGAGVGYVLTAAAMVYFQYLFAVCLVAHAAYAWRRRRTAAVDGAAIASAGAAIALLLLPAAVLVVEIGRSRELHAFGALPGAGDLVRALVPVRGLALLVPGLLLAGVAGALQGFRRQTIGPREKDGLVLLAVGALAPALLLFAVSRAAGGSLLEGRYVLGAAPAWAVLGGWALGRIEPPRAGRFALSGGLLLALVLRGELGGWTIAHGREDWRAAVAAMNAANDGRPVFLAGSFTESRDLAAAADPRRSLYLLAPLSYYRPAGPAGVLPLRFSSAAERFVTERLTKVPPPEGFAVIERSSRFPSWIPWLDERLTASGFTSRDVFRGGPLRVRVFERPLGQRPRADGSASGGLEPQGGRRIVDGRAGIDGLDDQSLRIDRGAFEVDASPQAGVERAAPLADRAEHDGARLGDDGPERESGEVLDHHGAPLPRRTQAATGEDSRITPSLRAAAVPQAGREPGAQRGGGRSASSVDSDLQMVSSRRAPVETSTAGTPVTCSRART